MGTHPIFESDFDCLTEMMGSMAVRRSLLFREARTFSTTHVLPFQVWKVRNVQYDYEQLSWRQYKRAPNLNQSDRFLAQYFDWHKNDEERIQELERYRISTRHLAAIMGKDPKTFTYDDQQAAVKYLLPGYVMYAEGNPKLEHPQEWMGPYRNPESLAKQQNISLNDGRPDHFLYFNSDITILDAINKLQDYYNFLVNEHHRIEEDFAQGKLKEYPEDYINCLNRTETEISDTEKFVSPAAFLGYEKLDKRYEQEFLNLLKKIHRLPTSYLAQNLLAEFGGRMSETPDLYDDFYSTTIDEIEVLGEIQKNRHISSALGCWNGQNQVNVTVIADGSGKFDINGIPFHKFFADSPEFFLRAISPLTAMQRLDHFDIVVGALGTPVGQRAHRGTEEHKWVYARASKMHLPYKGAEPRFGPGLDHTAALLNGGSRIARAVSQGIAIAMVPFISPQEARIMKQMGFQLDDVKRKERSWFAGAGVGRLRGRKGKKWRRR